MANVNDTLAERGSRYGDFATHAQITQDLKAVFVASPRWTALSAAQKESLEMVAHKIGRILNGDPNYADSWHDIVGYAKLVEDLLTGSIANDKPMTATEVSKLGAAYGKSPVQSMEDQIAHAKSVAQSWADAKLADDGVQAKAVLNPASTQPKAQLPAPAPVTSPFVSPSAKPAVDAVAPVPPTDEDKSSR